MIRIENKECCCGCEACANICPKKCINMVEDEWFYYPKVDVINCINCGLCETVCPMQNTNMEPRFPNQNGYALRIKDDAARFKSTSGGASYLMAKKVLEDNGIAYGVIFDNDFQTILGRVSNEDYIESLQGSKYPQCRIGDALKYIRDDLNKGRKVVVFGTPCFIHGLTRFLGRTFDNLILVDLICHGVPSPILWKEYISRLFDRENIKKVVFKHKKNGWKKWGVYIKSNKREYFEERTNDLYMSSYLCGLNVRPSCYSCKFKGFNRVSDITIADAWGIPEGVSFLNDDKGLSSIIINTVKGEEFFKSIQSETVCSEFFIDDLIEGNRAYHDVIAQNILRKRFFYDLLNDDVINVLKKYSINTIKGKVSTKLTGIIQMWRS